jgi:hypothetical protein
MTDNDDATTETFEKWMGPVRQVIREGRQVPLLPPLPGETQPFAWAWEPAEVVSMDVDGRPVESATVMAVDGRGKLVVKFKDGEEITYDGGALRSTHDHP